jgi:hypothetical protein
MTMVQETGIMWLGAAVLLALLTLIIASESLVGEPGDAEVAAMKTIAMNTVRAACVVLALLSLAGCIIEEDGGRGGEWHHGGGWGHGDHYDDHYH